MLEKHGHCALFLADVELAALYYGKQDYIIRIITICRN